MSELLFSVKDVFSNDGYLKRQSKSHYNIPLYQRGYKWKPYHAEKLLTDIDNFKKATGKFYCLQNITLVPGDECFNVVDGQQRLGTLTLILHYLGEGDLVKNKVRFPDNSIRKQTNRFLNEALASASETINGASWEDFIEEDRDFDHQDIFHLFQVYKAIKQWFDNKSAGFSQNEFLDKLLNHVKVIINKVNDTAGEEKIFSNLNTKRIPLDGADLVRAILITRVAIEEGEREGVDIKNIVRANERRVKIGWILDQINNWWSRGDVNGYFGKIAKISSADEGGVKTFNDNYPINLLYRLLAESQGEKNLTLEFIEKHGNNSLGLYKSLIRLNDTLHDWFHDREIYHYLGYLFNLDRNITFLQIWKLWNNTDVRPKFIKALKERIKQTLMVENELIDFNDTDTDWYHQKPEMLLKGLILMDVIHSLKKNQPFMPHHGFNKHDNDIEHIFPQNPRDPEDKEAYINFLNEHVLKSKKDRFDTTNFQSKIYDDAFLEEVDAFISKHTGSIKIHSIGNLVLLYSTLNKRISNSPYAVKRAKVIEYFNQGYYIQPHTYHVFVRYFNDHNSKNIELEHWTNRDIEANAMQIANKIEQFFN